MNNPPIIDLEGLRDNSQLDNISTQISDAMNLSGFMYIYNHGIPTATITCLREKQIEFFALADNVKKQIAISEFNRGYLSTGQARMHGAKKHDQKEVFFWGAELAAEHPDIIKGLALCGPNQWPLEPNGFRSAVLEYAKEIQTLGNHLLRAIALSLKLPGNFFEPRYTSSLCRGQLIHYPPTTGGNDDFGVAPHTDFGCITLLLQQTAGLEVLTKKAEWVAAPPIDGTLVINIGDLLERWTDGRLPSTRHRVRNSTGAARYSIAMFHDPNPDAIVNAADMHSNTGRFEAVAAADYIVKRNKGAFSHYGKVAEK